MIIEGEYSRLSADDFEDFKHDYLFAKISSHEVRVKYDLSKKEYSLLTKQIRDELGLKSRPFTRAKYYYKVGRFWKIIKTIDGKPILYVSLPTWVYSEDDMKEIVEKCAKKHWDYKQCRVFLAGLERCTKIV